MGYWVSLEEEASGTPNEVCGFKIAYELTAPLRFALGDNGLWEINGKTGDEAIPLIYHGWLRLVSSPQSLGLYRDQVARAKLTLEHMRKLSADYPNCFWVID